MKHLGHRLHLISMTGVLCQEYLKLRSQHVASLKAAGESPYPHKFQVTISLNDFIDKYGNNIDAGQTLSDVVSVAGKDTVTVWELLYLALSDIMCITILFLISVLN